MEDIQEKDIAKKRVSGKKMHFQGGNEPESREDVLSSENESGE